MLSLTPGLHLLTNGDVDDPRDARQRFARELFSAQPISTSGEFLKIAARGLRDRSRSGSRDDDRVARGQPGHGLVDAGSALDRGPATPPIATRPARPIARRMRTTRRRCRRCSARELRVARSEPAKARRRCLEPLTASPFSIGSRRDSQRFQASAALARCPPATRRGWSQSRCFDKLVLHGVALLADLTRRAHLAIAVSDPLGDRAVNVERRGQVSGVELRRQLAGGQQTQVGRDAQFEALVYRDQSLIGDHVIALAPAAPAAVAGMAIFLDVDQQGFEREIRVRKDAREVDQLGEQVQERAPLGTAASLDDVGPRAGPA